MLNFPFLDISCELIPITSVLHLIPTRMVAVPGRSKGCHTCRKRRIKCGRSISLGRLRITVVEVRLGERKPSCQRCSKAGYTCAGYERPLEFRHASTARFLSSTKPDGTSEKGIPGPASSTAVAARPRLFSPPPELSLVAFQEDMYTAFLVANFVWRSYDTPWIEMATKGNLGQLSLHASQALSQTNFGSAHHQEEIKLDGMTQYSKVLKALAPQLSDPRRPGVEELIVPVMMLLIHAVSSYFRATRRRYPRRADMPITVIPGRPQRLHITHQRSDPAAVPLWPTTLSA